MSGTVTAYDSADVPCALCKAPSWGLWVSEPVAIPLCWDCDTSCGSAHPNATPWPKVPEGVEVTA